MLTIEFLGDSITEGAGAGVPERIYSAVCCKILHAKELNYGLSGTRIARQRVMDRAGDPDEDYIIRARWMDRTADFLFVFGGTNDFGHGDAPLGVMGDDTPFTFYGAMNVLCRNLTELYGFPKERICFIMPTHRFDEDSTCGDNYNKDHYIVSHPLKDYVKAEQEVCAKWGIETLTLKTLNAKPVQGPSELSIDGIHPSVKGHRLIGEELAAYIQKKGISERK